MATQIFKLWMTKGVGAYNRGDISLTIVNPEEYPTTVQGLAVVVLGEFNVELEVPEIDVTAKQIDMLQAAIQKERGESQLRVNALLDQISKLQCLEHKK